MKSPGPLPDEPPKPLKPLNRPREADPPPREDEDESPFSAFFRAMSTSSTSVWVKVSVASPMTLWRKSTAPNWAGQQLTRTGSGPELLTVPVVNGKTRLPWMLISVCVPQWGKTLR